MIVVTELAEKMLAEAVAAEGPNPTVRLYQAGVG